MSERMDSIQHSHNTTTSPSLASPSRHTSWNGLTEARTASPTVSRKRSADPLPSDAHVPRKGRACLACRKLKVKCDSLERGDAGCSRCQRLSQKCITSKRLRMSLEGEGDQPHPSIARLDNAVADILSRLKMPPLESYTRQQRVSESVSQTTRENSREPLPEGEHEMAPAPMGSLYEVTQLNSLRSRLKHGDPARRNSKTLMEADLISQGVITLEEAEEMLTLFKTSLSRYLFDAIISEDRTLISVRQASTLFFTAIIAVSSLHIPGKEKIHQISHKQLRDLCAASMFDRFHTLEDIRALCIAAFWIPDLSWKLSGHCVRMATELNLHQAFHKAMYSSTLTSADREHAFERARLWYLLYVLDHHFSIAYGRPPVTAELQAIKEYDVFLKAPECTPSDRRVLSQVTLFIILSKAYNVFGLEAERLMEGDDVTLLTHLRFIEDLDRWRYQFRHALDRDAHVGDYPAVGVDLHYYFASMMLNSLSLRGRSPAAISHLPTSLRPLALHAIESAHQILQIVLDESSIRDSMVGVPLYLHTVIAFAVVFLIKMSFLWTDIGVTIDAKTRTKPLIERIISLFRGCKAGGNHILYNMATGFERLLRCNRAPAIANLPEQFPGARSRPPNVLPRTDSMPGSMSGSITSGPDYTPRSGFDPASASLGRTDRPAYDPYGIGSSSETTFGRWQTEDDMLWSVGVGYDLLATAPDANEQSYAFHDMLRPQML